jgi:cysteine desulfurase/selenocysteine lyase
VDVNKLDCDWLVASGHKVFGPTGIGVLYGKYQLMEALPPYQGGGDMIETVSFERTTFKAPPARFEAGTPHISGALGLAAALDYLDTLPQAALTAHEEQLLARGRAVLAAIPGVRVIGDSDAKVPILSFTMAGIHPHDIASVLDASGVAIRAGHHCAMPLMQRLGLSGTARASFAFYNSLADVDALERGLQRVVKLFG